MPNKVHTKTHRNPGKRRASNKRNPKPMVAKAKDAKPVKELLPYDARKIGYIAKCVMALHPSLSAYVFERISYADIDGLYKELLSLNDEFDSAVADAVQRWSTFPKPSSLK